ncbi:transmembrane protein, partial [Cystoisospora suis]
MPGGHTSTTLGKGGGGGGDRARPLLDCFEHFFFLFPSFRFLKSFTTSHTLFLTFLGFSLFLTFPSPSFSPLPSSYTFVSASTTSDKTGEEGLSSSASSPSLPDKTDLCQLTGIDLSSGRLPNFDVHTLEYTVNLTTQQSEIILLPRFQCPRDIPSHLLPSVTVEGQHVDIFTPLGVKLDLDPNQKWRTLHMSIRNPGNSKADTLDYRFHINQQNAVKAEPQLEKIFFRDSRGKLLQPVRLFEKSNDVFTLASGPDDTYVQLEAHCDPSSSMYINGSRMLFGSSVKISREEDQPNSMVTVECRRTSGGQLEGDIQRRAHFFNVLWTRINLPLPYKLIMHSTASSCEIIPEEDSRILCKNEGSFASLFSLFSPSIMYKVTTTTEDETDSFLLPLINGGWTPRFPLREDLRLVATAGDAQTSWKLDFMTIFPLPSSIPSWVQSIQEYSALCLLISVVIISSLLLLAVLTAQGSPRKFSEAPSIALFFFQIALFLQLLKGGGSGKGVLETTGSPFLRLTSLFLPLPPYTVKSNVQLAGGCLVSSLVILGIVAFLRIFFITTLHQQRSSQKAKERESRQHPGSKASSLSSLVLPHNLNFGNVENRLLFVLAFPICASSAILIAEGDSPWLSRMIGITVLSFMTMYWIGIYYKVRQYVKTDQVTWVWNCPLMDGTDDRAGYWCDRVCDQLQSEPINWTVCQCTPAGKWLAPAARIAAVALDEQGLQSAGIGDSSSTYEAEKQQLREELWFLRHDAPVGSTAVDVDAIDSYHGHATTTATTLVPCVRDLSIGIVRFEWLDILFSVHTLNAVLTHLKQSFLTRTGFTLPLTVKLNQLSGPITSGSLGLFFELRTPCARIFEGITRSLLGVMLGLAFSFSNYTSIHYAHSSSLLLTFLASLSLFIWIFYLYYDKPFHREAENFFFPLIFGVLGFNAFLHSI